MNHVKLDTNLGDGRKIVHIYEENGTKSIEYYIKQK